MDHRFKRWRSFAGALLLLTLFVVAIGSAQSVQYPQSTLHPRGDFERSRPGQGDARQSTGAPGDQPGQQMRTGKPAIAEPGRHGQIEVNHGRFEDQGPDSRVFRGRTDGDRRPH